MTSFFKEFLLEDGKKLAPGKGRDLLLAAFGKHPGWKDHIEAIGLATESLKTAHRLLYDDGLGGKGGPITSGAWDSLPAEELVPGFGHRFLWVRGDQFLLGRMWASSDSAQPPRTRYPMLVCVEGVGVPLTWALRNIPAKLEEIPAMCRIRDEAEIGATVQAASARAGNRDELRAHVVASLAGLQAQLRSLLPEVPSESPTHLLTPRERERFLAAPELGPEREGLWRILYQGESRFSAFKAARSLARSDSVVLHPQQLRVPTCAESVTEGMLAWRGFLLGLLPGDVPILFTAPVGAGWIDITVGEPTPDQLFCLRATPKAMPLASSIPFTLEANFRQRSAEVVRLFQSGEAPPAPKSSSDTATLLMRKLKAVEEKAQHLPFWKKPPVLLVCGAIAVALGAGLWSMNNRPADPEDPAGEFAQAPTQPPVVQHTANATIAQNAKLAEKAAQERAAAYATALASAGKGLAQGQAAMRQGNFDEARAQYLAALAQCDQAERAKGEPAPELAGLRRDLSDARTAAEKVAAAAASVASEYAGALGRANEGFTRGQEAVKARNFQAAVEAYETALAQCDEAEKAQGKATPELVTLKSRLAAGRDAAVRAWDLDKKYAAAVAKAKEGLAQGEQAMRQRDFKKARSEFEEAQRQFTLAEQTKVEPGAEVESLKVTLAAALRDAVEEERNQQGAAAALAAAESRAKAGWDQGQRAMEQKNYEAALEAYLAALEECRKAEEASSAPIPAIVELKKALETGRKLATERINAAKTYAAALQGAQQRLDRGREALKQGRLDGADGALAEFQAGLNQCQEAEKANGVTTAEVAALRQQLELGLRQVADRRQVAQAYATALERANMAMERGQAAMQQGNLEEALAAYDAALQQCATAENTAGKSPALDELKSRLSTERAKADQGRQNAGRFRELLAAAQEAEKARDYAAALTRYEDAAKLRPNDPAVAGKIAELRRAVSTATTATTTRTAATAATATTAAAASKQPKLEEVDKEFETLLVRFRVVKPKDPWLTSPEARNAEAMEGQLSRDARDYYMTRVSVIRIELTRLESLTERDRDKYLKRLVQKITYW